MRRCKVSPSGRENRRYHNFPWDDYALWVWSMNDTRSKYSYKVFAFFLRLLPSKNK